MADVLFEAPGDWVVTERPVQAGVVAEAGAVRRGGGDDSLPAEFLASGVEIDKIYDITTGAPRRGGAAPVVAFQVEGSADERFVAVVRHASGAITFHQSDERIVHQAAAGTRRGGRGKTTQHFTIGVGGTQTLGARRGIIGRAVKLFLLKVVDTVAGRLVETLAEAWEKRSFAKADIVEGFVKITEDGLASRKLQRATPAPTVTPSGRALLLIHGTFSNTVSSFEHLKSTKFFERARTRYGDQIYGFDHYTLSKTPEENAHDILTMLNKGAVSFDVVTYSRGGLVLRNLIERAEAFGTLSGRFKLGHAVLVASPNQGTPLATPDRWQDTVGWLATLLDYFPDNPLTTAASFIGEAVVWIAKHATGSLPGLAAMNANGDWIGEIQTQQGAALPYSALGANYVPDASWLQRMADVGVDAFFGQANDLVVPTEGAWRVDVAGAAEGSVPSERVACYGPGGNVASVGAGAHHFNFFGRAETVDFIFDAFEGKPHLFPKLDLGAALPNGLRRSRSAMDGVSVAAPAPGLGLTKEETVPESTRRRASDDAGEVSETPAAFSDAFHITIVPPPEFVREVDLEDGFVGEAPAKKSKSALIIASFAGGRVVAPLGLQDGAAGKRWQQLIAHERTIKAFIDGDPGAVMPTSAQMIEYGRLLFETLFPKNVRRLYDTARARVPGGRLSVVFTSAIPWVAQVPWEFAWDPTMESFLVTEELEFIRNPLTVEPAEVISARPGKLRILVVVAQPLDQNALSVEEEKLRIMSSFKELLDADLVELNILQQATPQRLHQYVRQRHFDVVHFIGHGEYDDKEERGYLIFENDEHMTQRVSARSMKEILGGRNIRLVFLNACETGRDRGGSRTDFNRGVAQSLVASGIHSVVANQYLVLDIAAVGFAQHFYWGLARGETIGCAAREARIAVNYSIAGESIDWAVPVVYARDPSARLSTPTTGDVKLYQGPWATDLQTERRARRMAAASGVATVRKLSVAIWDMENSFPGLEGTLARLNAAQATYEFKRTDVSAPLGSLQRVEGKGVQLYANAAEHRIQRAQQELGADYLIVITPRRITYDEDGTRYHSYFIWWGGDDSGKYAIISSGIDGLPRIGPNAERAVTNQIVSALVGAATKFESHSKGARNCPLYLNEDDDLSVILGEQRFEKKCRDDVAGEMPGEIDALEALLRVFDSEGRSEGTEAQAASRRVRKARRKR